MFFLIVFILYIVNFVCISKAEKQPIRELEIMSVDTRPLSMLYGGRYVSTTTHEVTFKAPRFLTALFPVYSSGEKVSAHVSPDGKTVMPVKTFKFLNRLNKPLLIPIALLGVFEFFPLISYLSSVFSAVDFSAVSFTAEHIYAIIIGLVLLTTGSTNAIRSYRHSKALESGDFQEITATATRLEEIRSDRDVKFHPVYTYEINGVKEELISRRISSRIGNTVILYRNTKTLEIIEGSGFSYKSGIILALLGIILILYSVLSGIGII